MIIGGPASQLIAGRVAAILGDELALCDYKTFPDGEAYTQVMSGLDGNDGKIAIIQSTPTDRDIIYLLQLLDVCRGRDISLIMPYFGYARQDKIFKMGEPMAARAVATALNPFLEGGRVYLINIHAKSILSHFKCKSEDLDATPLLADRARSFGLERPIVISPDKGALSMAKAAAEHMGAEYDYLQKTRLSGTEVSMVPKEIDVRDRDIVIFDDMIATGGTMATAISLLRRQGARRVYLAAVHPVLTGSAVLKLYSAGVEAILSTDTLDKGVGTVSVAPLIADALKAAKS
jgi:ribose-phosphate pyrophosphokinase